MTLTQREQRRLQVLNEVEAGRWSVTEAAQVLGLSERQVWRLRASYRAQGAVALVHGNQGRVSPWRISEEVRQRVVELLRGQYDGCNDSHLLELLALREGIVLSRKSIERIRHAAGLSPVRRHRAPRHRRRRDRMPQAGMLLQIDGSPHHWLGPDQPRCTLLGAIDDATGEPVAAVLRQQEDAHGYFLLLRQIVRSQGIPLDLDHDRHGIFQRDRQAPWSLEEQLAGRPEPTQFGRALEELGILSIAARSPQPRLPPGASSASGGPSRTVWWPNCAWRALPPWRVPMPSCRASWRATPPVLPCGPTIRAWPIGPWIRPST